MRRFVWMVLVAPFFCVSPVSALQGNAVEVEKKRSEDLRREQFPAWPGRPKIRAPQAVLPPVKPPAVNVPEPKRICSIPLTNVMRSAPKLSRMPQFRPDPGHFVMPNVQLPAPPCDDSGKR